MPPTARNQASRGQCTLQRTVQRQVGVLCFLLWGCSQVDDEATRAPDKTSQVGGASGKPGAAGASPNTIVDSGAPRGGTTSTIAAVGGNSTSVGGRTYAGGKSNIEESGGNAGTAGLTSDPPPSGGTAGTANTDIVVQGGTASKGGTAALPQAGAAGSSARPAETLTQLIARFCALKDVLTCTPDCAATRQAEAAFFTKCRELYRQLMACQVELIPSERVCRAGLVPTVTSPNDCTNEDIAYSACVGLPQS